MRGGLLAAAGLGALLVAGAGQAETLRDALVQTYRTNPTITGQRAQVRTLERQANFGKPTQKSSANIENASCASLVFRSRIDRKLRISSP